MNSPGNYDHGIKSTCDVAFGKKSGRKIWLNGRLVRLDSAGVSPLDRGFLYGDGFFETIRSEGGKPLYLDMHIERLRTSLFTYRIALDPMPDWRAAVRALVCENGLDRGMASVKILVTRGVEPSVGLPAPQRPTVCIFAGEYTPPRQEAYATGWDLHVFDEGYSPPLSAHKSLNYLYYLTARQAALDAGRHEAVILDRDGQAAETSAGSILASTGGRWWTPGSKYRLPGITLRAICEILLESGIEVERRKALPEELLRAQTVWVLSSLIGIMPAAAIDGRALSDPAPAEAKRLRALLFERGVGR
jgi:branched-chain amino acid aminotransferase